MGEATRIVRRPVVAGRMRSRATLFRRAWKRRDRRWDPALAAAAATVSLSLYFLAAPGVDLFVAEAFHRPGEGFALAAEPALKALRRTSTLAQATVVVVALVLLVRAALSGGFAGLARAWRSGCVLAGLALGPGLLVNGLLKDYWGRPRPVQLEMFGGDAPYVEVWRISSWCQDNCSFVSGEGSAAAWLVAATLLLPPAIRRAAVPATATYAAALSMNRVAFGGHFLSDVLLSWSLTFLLMGLLVALARPSERPFRMPLKAKPATA